VDVFEEVFAFGWGDTFDVFAALDVFDEFD
jgi:hypothetical protein